jgi:PAS domain S-box-containing protein
MPSTPIDYHTLFLAAGIVAATFLGLHAIQARKPYPGFVRTVVGTDLLTAAIVAGDLRGFVSDALWIIQVIAIFAFALIDGGIRLFCEAPRRGRWPIVYVAAAILLLTSLFFIQPLYVRILFTSLLLIPIFVDASLPLLGRPPNGRSFGYRFTAAAFALGCVTACVRIVAMFQLQKHASPYFAEHPVNTVFFLLVMFLLLSLSFGLLTLTHERLVAEFKAAHEQLKSTHERLLLALEASSSGTFEWIIENDLNIWGVELEKLYGFEPGTFPGSRSAWLECVLPEDVAQVDEADREALKTGHFGTEWRIRRKNDGQIRWILSHARVQFDQEGKPERMIGINVDVTERKRAEEKIRLSEQRYRSLVKASSQLVWTCDAHGYFGHEIDDWQRFTGQTTDQVDGFGWLNAIHPEDRDKTLKAWLHATQAGSAYAAECRLLRHDGNYRVMQERATPVFDNTGHVFEWIGMSTDVTDQRFAEEKIKVSEQRYRSLVKASAQLVWTCDAYGYLKHDIEDWQLFTGQTSEQMSGWGWLDAIHPDDREKTRKAWQKAIQTKSIYSVDYRLRRNDGTYRFTQARGAPVFDSSGQVTEWVGMNTDVTEQRLAEERERLSEEKIRLSEQRYRSLVRASSQLVWTSDPDGYRSQEVEDWQRFTGQTSEQQLGWGWLNAVHPEDRDKTVMAVRHAMETKAAYILDYRLRRSDGTYRIMERHAVPVLDDNGKLSEWVGMSIDVTEQRLAEERLRRNEKLAAAGRLALHISHEINNPLEAITNLIYLIGGDPGLNEATRKFIVSAERELTRVSQVATRNLRFANIYSRSDDVDLRELTDSVAEFFRAPLETDHISIERDYRTEARLRCYPHELQVAIANLFSNAHDAMRKGGKLIIRIRECRSWTNPGVQGLKLTIADTGKGIPHDVRHRVFEPFFTTKEETGAGLGLWVCNEIMQKHEGRIMFRTSTASSHSGTVFSLFFPFQRSPGAHVEVTRPAA